MITTRGVLTRESLLVLAACGVGSATVMGVLILGLTGGIGSGKSTVSQALAERGAVVIDADLVAREVVAPGTPGLSAVLAEFGGHLQRTDGSLDREALGRGRVRRRPGQGARLSGDPASADRCPERRALGSRRGGWRRQVLVHDVPLLVENDLQDSYDEVIVVDVPPDVQLDRLVRLRGMDLAGGAAADRVPGHAGAAPLSPPPG